MPAIDDHLAALKRQIVELGSDESYPHEQRVVLGEVLQAVVDARVKLRELR